LALSTDEDVLRLERIAVLRVSTVAEVTAEALEGVQRLGRGLETLDDARRAYRPSRNRAATVDSR
jgi:hypothetical protein